jgi:hypothetical protein
MSSGLKHLLTCRCVLPQFKRLPDPPQHQFVVFSVIDDNNVVKTKFAQCNNCGIIHKVIDVCRSEIVSRESMGSLPTVDDLKLGMPPQLVNVLETADVDVSTWEHARFVWENEDQWGGFVILSTDEEDGLRQGKYVQILSKTMFKVDTFTREELVK